MRAYLMSILDRGFPTNGLPVGTGAFSTFARGARFHSGVPWHPSPRPGNPWSEPGFRIFFVDIFNPMQQGISLTFPVQLLPRSAKSLEISRQALGRDPFRVCSTRLWLPSALPIHHSFQPRYDTEGMNRPNRIGPTGGEHNLRNLPSSCLLHARSTTT